MDADTPRTALLGAALVGVLVLVLVVAVGLVRADADTDPPGGARPPVSDEASWRYGWCRCGATSDLRR